MNPSTHPIHPTTSTSTHERATMDGSTIEATKARLEHEEQTLAAEIEHLGQQITNALIDRIQSGIIDRPTALARIHGTAESTCCELHRPTGCCDPNDCGPCCPDCPTCPTLDDLGRGEEFTTETTDQSRPVVGLVAHVVDLDAIEAREDEHYAVRVDVPALMAEVRRLREREAALIRAKDVDLDDVRDQLADVEAARTADAATIGVLSAAVAKVAAIHVDDGDGWCKACQTLGYPCPTVLALGAGR